MCIDPKRLVYLLGITHIDKDINVLDLNSVERKTSKAWKNIDRSKP
jgi:hypothetical protein